MQPNTDPEYLRSQGLSPVIVKRFFDRLIGNQSLDECWTLAGGRNGSGYTTIHVGNITVGGHVVSFIVFIGPIPEGHYVLHDCPNGDNRACVNPHHLWSGTQAENLQDMVAKGRCYAQIPGVRVGVKNGRAILTEEQVRLVQSKESWKRGEKTEWAKRFGVSASAICRIVFGWNWKR